VKAEHPTDTYISGFMQLGLAGGTW